MSAIMNLGDLKAFVAVAEAGSVNRAAAKLNLTQPAVSRRVQNLEAAIGVVLLDRSAKPPTLTEEGRRALAYGRKVLHAIDDLASQIGAKGVLGGEFRLGIAPGFTDTALGQPLDAVMRSFPNISLRITSDWSGKLLEQLQSDSLDAAFVLLTEPRLVSKDAQLRSFPQDSVVVIAARRAPMSSSSSIAELGQHPWVLNPRGCGFRAALQRTLDQERGHLNLCADVQGYDLQLSLITRGVGLRLAPRARWKASPSGKDVTMLKPHSVPFFETPAIVTRTGHDRF